MAHDYQYWRLARRGNTAPWRFFSIAGGGEDVSAEVPPIQTTIADPRRAPLRSANSVYWRDNQLQIVDEVPQNGRVHELRLVYRRAAQSEYWRPNQLQIPDEVPQNGRILFPVPSYQRTANPAYFVNPSFVVPDVTSVPPILPVIADFARTSLRTANTAYWQALRFQIGDEVPQNGRIFEPILPYRRTAGTAYSQTLGVQIIEELPRNGTLVDPLQAYRRAAREAYAAYGKVILDAAETPPIAAFFADIHRAKRRSAQTSYWRMGQFVVPDLVITPDDLQSKPTIFDIQRLRVRAANDSYRIYPARAVSLVYQPEGKILYPDHNNTFGRKIGANSAYWRHNAGAIPVLSFPEELSAKLMPVKQWRPLRTSNGAYWKDNFGPIPVVTFPSELSVKVLPARAPGQRRSANTAYVVNSRYTEVTTAFPLEIRPAIFPVRPLARSRAAHLAYWVPSPFLVQFPRSLEPLIIAKGRTLVLSSTSRDFIIPAKRRLFKPKPKRP